MGLMRTAPQRVEHTDGWSLGSAGREAMRYEDEHGPVRVAVEHGLNVSIVDPASLRRIGEDGTPVTLEPADAAVVLARVVEGMVELTEQSVELAEG